jgi:hypothetical protein
MKLVTYLVNVTVISFVATLLFRAIVMIWGVSASFPANEVFKNIFWVLLVFGGPVYGLYRLCKK